MHPSPSVQTPALRTVGNIVTGNETQTQTVIDAGAVPNLLELFSHSKKGIQKEACWAISNITAGNKDQIQSTIDANVIPPLVKLLKSAEFDVKKEAAWAISNATSGGTPRQIKFLVSQDCIPPLCELLSAADEKLVTTALEALGNILQVGSADAGDLSANKMAILIVKSEGPTSIRQVGSARAKAMLESYFQDWESWDLSPVSVSPDDFDGAAERGHRAEEKAAHDAVDAVAVEFPLHAAAKAGQVDALARLLDEGADVDQTNGDGETPLWIACLEGRVDAARLLLDRGAEVNRADDYGQTPLWVACLNGHIDVARLCLTRGANIDLATQKGTTPLAIAQKKGHATIVAMLADVGVKATDKPLNAGDGALVAEAPTAASVDVPVDVPTEESTLDAIDAADAAVADARARPAPVAEKAAVDADVATTPSEAEPMKVLQSIWDASAVATASRGDLRFMPFSEGVDLSKLVELRTLEGHSDVVRRAASTVLL